MLRWFDFHRPQAFWRPSRDGALLVSALILGWLLPPTASLGWVIGFLVTAWLVSHLDFERIRRALRGEP